MIRFLLVLFLIAACGDNGVSSPSCEVDTTCSHGGASAPRDAQCVVFVRVSTQCVGGGDMSITHSIGDKSSSLSLGYECGETFITEWQVPCDDIDVNVDATAESSVYSCSAMADCP